MCILKGTRNPALVSESSEERVQISRWVSHVHGGEMARILLTAQFLKNKKPRKKQLDVHEYRSFV